MYVCVCMYLRSTPKLNFLGFVHHSIYSVRETTPHWKKNETDQFLLPSHILIENPIFPYLFLSPLYSSQSVFFPLLFVRLTYRIVSFCLLLFLSFFEKSAVVRELGDHGMVDAPVVERSMISASVVFKGDRCCVVNLIVVFHARVVVRVISLLFACVLLCGLSHCYLHACCCAGYLLRACCCAGFRYLGGVFGGARALPQLAHLDSVRLDGLWPIALPRFSHEFAPD